MCLCLLILQTKFVYNPLSLVAFYYTASLMCRRYSFRSSISAFILFRLAEAIIEASFQPLGLQWRDSPNSDTALKCAEATVQQNFFCDSSSHLLFMHSKYAESQFPCPPHRSYITSSLYLILFLIHPLAATTHITRIMLSTTRGEVKPHGLICHHFGSPSIPTQLPGLSGLQQQPNQHKQTPPQAHSPKKWSAKAKTS